MNSHLELNHLSSKCPSLVVLQRQSQEYDDVHDLEATLFRNRTLKTVSIHSLCGFGSLGLCWNFSDSLSIFGGKSLVLLSDLVELSHVLEEIWASLQCDEELCLLAITFLSLDSDSSCSDLLECCILVSKDTRTWMNTKNLIWLLQIWSQLADNLFVHLSKQLQLKEI